MDVSEKLISELQNRLKVGNRRGVHLNAIPGRSRYKFDLSRLNAINENLPNDFIKSLLTEQPLHFKISWKDNVPDLNSLLEEEQTNLVRITKSFENLINQTDAIDSEKGINTFGFGYPVLIRRDQSDNKLTVAPILIWSLSIKRTKEFNTWIIQRGTEDPIYINEVLINHLQNDAKIEIGQISSEMLDDGLIDKNELVDICAELIKAINTTTADDLKNSFIEKLNNVVSIKEKKHYEKLPLTSNNSFIEFGGLFSIFEVQKQNIIHDYENLLDDLNGAKIDLNDMDEHFFQPISSIETDPSQQSILHSLESKRNILIQGPPGTGKSQSLTAILVNALENQKKTIVVCEKRTALEVLYNALNKKGLGQNCVLIKDIVKDRRLVVDSVRARIDRSSYKKYTYQYSRETLEEILENANSFIKSINNKHWKLDKTLIRNRNWTQVVGILLKQLKYNDEPVDLEFDSKHLCFDSKEFNELMQIIGRGEKLYKAYLPFVNRSFINSDKFKGENPFSIEQQIEEDFSYYENEIRGNNSVVRSILETNNPDLFHYRKTRSILFQFSAYFSKSKKKTLTDQKKLEFACKKIYSRIEADDWLNQKLCFENSKKFVDEISQLIETKEKYFSDENDIFSIEFNWFNYYHSLTENSKAIIDDLRHKKNWETVFLIFYLQALLTRVADNNLPTNDNDYKELQESLLGVEKEQIGYINSFWYSKQISATRKFYMRNPDLSVENLYNKRSSNKFKRLSLRQIVKFDIDLFSTFFPVILTTPDVCSNLFKGQNKYFDIVMFDEASQLKLEDNLPAMLKGKQVVIAGDEHQMPPSNYFSKIFDGSIEDEDDFEDEDDVKLDRDDILLSCESLLDFATELKFEKRHLDFHYRSKHPYLIDFSNHAFYHKRLKPLPNDVDYTPIKYIPVDGTYSDNTNDVEAETVLSIITNNIHRLPNGDYPSVGVATFNINQRNLIISKIIERRKFQQYKKFNDKILELEEKGFFVKNLENIQGDERDIIILSTTYGINKEGKFAQRFGSINHQKGYKLLNVIITRAKYKVYVCSSIPEKVFLNYSEYLTTEGANNRRAVFYAYLAYAKAVSENDAESRNSVLETLSENCKEESSIGIFHEDLESPFEEEVYATLLEHFDEENITIQYPYAGFRIDLVYYDRKKDSPKIAIECDGAKYHSSREAYLHDLHRQKILESHGFVFHRIWSTNWWRNPQRETKSLVDFINNCQTKVKPHFDKIALAFTDDIEILCEELNDSQLGSKEGVKGIEQTLNADNIRFRIQESKSRSTIITEKSPETWESKTCYWSLNEKLGYRFSPSKNAWYKKKEGTATTTTNSQEETAEANSQVKYKSIVELKYLNNKQKMKVQLCINNSGTSKSNGIQKINIKSPLGLSLMNKKVGDTVRVGNLDNYVEIMAITN